MRSPWLDIPLADYEGHMGLPGIGQADMLAAQFAELLGEWAPESVAVIGCAGGNGFDRVRADITRRVVGIDINPKYVEELAYRYAARLPGLELYVRDIQDPVQRIEPVDLIYAALVLEYVSPTPVLHNLRRICRPEGILATVLQLPSEHEPVASPSPYTALQRLTPAMHLVSPTALASCAREAGFLPLRSHQIILSSGKGFAVQVFQATGTPVPQ